MPPVFGADMLRFLNDRQATTQTAVATSTVALVKTLRAAARIQEYAIRDLGSTFIRQDGLGRAAAKDIPQD